MVIEMSTHNAQEVSVYDCYSFIQLLFRCIKCAGICIILGRYNVRSRSYYAICHNHFGTYTHKSKHSPIVRLSSMKIRKTIWYSTFFFGKLLRNTHLPCSLYIFNSLSSYFRSLVSSFSAHVVMCLCVAFKYYLFFFELLCRFHCSCLLANTEQILQYIFSVWCFTSPHLKETTTNFRLLWTIPLE